MVIVKHHSIFLWSVNCLCTNSSHSETTNFSTDSTYSTYHRPLVGVAHAPTKGRVAASLKSFCSYPSLNVHEIVWVKPYQSNINYITGKYFF